MLHEIEMVFQLALGKPASDGGRHSPGLTDTVQRMPECGMLPKGFQAQSHNDFPETREK
jgi:hypothetical protein